MAYTLLARHVPLNAWIISAKEHESHYVFDVLFNNVTDIQPDTHSTDTHGANQVNFALLYLFGYRFAPRYRDFRAKPLTNLYGFKHPNVYGGCPLKPIRRIRVNLINSEWPNIERILLSLALKTTTQSVIVSTLSTYRRQNRTKKALWEFDNIIKSLYLLDYVDSPALRRNVKEALTRRGLPSASACHCVHSRRSIPCPVATGAGSVERIRPPDRQCCGALQQRYFSEVLHALENPPNKAAASLKRISPLAWQHIKFYGRYRFDSDLMPIDLAALASRLPEANADLWLKTA